MRIKHGVRFADGRQAVLVAAQVVQEVCREMLHECVVTSGSEDRRPNTLHGRGWAIDFRANHIFPPPRRVVFSDTIRERLGDGFDVVLHGDDDAVHVHVEYDPKD